MELDLCELTDVHAGCKRECRQTRSKYSLRVVTEPIGYQRIARKDVTSKHEATQAVTR